MAPKVTQTFDMAIGEYGQDYAVPVGTPIYTPVAGTVGTQDTGKAAWGKRAIVNAASGLSFAVGHLTSFAVSAGQKVQPGDLIGYSGGAPSDPSSGVSTGPHVETQFFQMTSKGLQYIDPRNVFKQFGSWEQSIFNRGASAAGSAAGAATSSLNPLAGVGDAISAATSVFQRIAFGGLALGFFTLGLFLIFFGDIEKAADKVGDIAEKVAPAAAVAA